MSATTTIRPSTGRRSAIQLWTAQSVLAALFLFAGVMKLITPADQLAAQAHLSGFFLQFIGVCETLGALGLILPGLFRIQKVLTPIAAAGLVIIMTGATLISLERGEIAAAVMPTVVGLLAFSVVHGRREWAARSAVRQPALTPAR